MRLQKNVGFVHPLVVLIVTFVLSSISGSLAGYLKARFDVETTLYVRKEILQRYFLPELRPKSKSEADGISLIMNDASLISSGVVSIVSVAVETSLTFIGSFIGAVYFFPNAVVLAGVLFVLFFVMTWFFGQKMRKLRITFQDEKAATTNVVASLINARSQIFLYGVTSKFKKIGENSFRRLSVANLQLEKTQAFLTPIIDVCMKATFLVGIGIAAVQVGLRNSSFGDFLAFTVYFQAFTSSFQQLLSVTITVQEAKAGQDRIISSFSSFSPTPISTIVRKGSAVDIKELTCRYGSSAPILKNLSCSIPETGITALVGGSGSGKTTLLKVLIGEKEIDGGTIYLSRNLASAGKIAVVEQNLVTIPGTWSDNIAFGREQISDAEVEEKMIAVGLAGDMSEAHRLAKNDISAASGGELQRLMLARALVGEPRALFLDEPTSNVDGQMEHLMIETVKRCAQSISVLIVAHRPYTVQASDHLAMLKDGKIVLAGRTDECLQKSADLRRLLGEWNLR